jgi:PhnB protein
MFTISPYIFQHGRCKEAMEFYEKIFETKNKKIEYFGKVLNDQNKPIPENITDYVLHGEMEIEGWNFMFADLLGEVNDGSNINFSVIYQTIEKSKEIFDKLLEGGKILMEPSPKPYSQYHGVVKDKFGISWQIICQPKFR